MRVRSSLWDFLWGILTRWYVLLPALALDPFDLVEQFSNYEWDPPVWVMWTIFGLSLFVAVWLTYREVWTKVEALEVRGLDNTNQNACLSVLDEATAILRDSRERFEASLIWDQQLKILADTGVAVQSLMIKVVNLGRPLAAMIVNYELRPPYDESVDSSLRWFNRLEDAINTAREDIWRGRH